ncbi:MAG: hypothetical protein AB1805_07440 [Nitrospirota bacterium]
MSIAERSAISHQQSAFDPLQSYKQAYFELYGELLAAVREARERGMHDADLLRLLDAATDRVMQARSAFLLGADTNWQWHCVGLSLELLHRRAEEVMRQSIDDNQLVELFGRSQVLALQAHMITRGKAAAMEALWS